MQLTAGDKSMAQLRKTTTGFVTQREEKVTQNQDGSDHGSSWNFCLSVGKSKLPSSGPLLGFRLKHPDGCEGCAGSVAAALWG